MPDIENHLDLTLSEIEEAEQTADSEQASGDDAAEDASSSESSQE